jgi:tetratricopeptide (TPR) repeat protein
MELDEALGCNDALVADKLNLAATGIALGAYEAALTELENIQDGQTLPPLLRARWLGLLGQVLTRLGRLAQADAPLKAAFALSRHIGDRDLEWWLAGRMANLYWARGEIKRAVMLAREYYKSAVASSHARSCVDLSESLAKFYIHSWRGSEALDWANRCAPTANARNIWRYRMRAQLRLAQAYRLLNDLVNAQAYAQEALRLYQQRNQTLEEHGELMQAHRECVGVHP